jgi:hypothetical protein
VATSTDVLFQISTKPDKIFGTSIKVETQTTCLLHRKHINKSHDFAKTFCINLNCDKEFVNFSLQNFVPI